MTPSSVRQFVSLKDSLVGGRYWREQHLWNFNLVFWWNSCNLTFSFYRQIYQECIPHQLVSVELKAGVFSALLSWVARVTNVCNLKLIDLWHFGPPGCRPAQSDLFHYTRARSTKTNWKILKLKGSDEISRAESRWADTYNSCLASCSIYEIQILLRSYWMSEVKCLFLAFTTILTVRKEEIWQDE